MLSTWGWDIDQAARRAELERWVEGGGRLVVDAALISGTDAFEEWSGIARERDEPDPDEDPFQAPEIVESVSSARSRRADDARADDEAARAPIVACNFDYGSLARDRHAARSGR